MVPDTVLRLASIRKALDEIVRPALAEDVGFAQEQLALILKSIDLVREQIPHEYALHAHDAHAAARFARELAGQLPGAAGALEAAANAAEALAPATLPDLTGLAAAVRTLRGTIEEAISAAGADPATLARIGPVVLKHSETQNLIERRWVMATGFDPSPGTVPPLAELLTDGFPA